MIKSYWADVNYRLNQKTKQKCDAKRRAKAKRVPTALKKKSGRPRTLT